MGAGDTASRGIRVALLNPTFWPEVRRGSERMIRDLATGLIDRGQRPRLIVGSPGGRTEAIEGGLAVIRTRRAGDRLASRLGFHEQVGHAPFQHAEMRRGDDDLAHAFYVTDAGVAARWSAASGRPFIFSVMGVANPKRIEASPVRRRAWGRALGASAAVVALSEAAAAPLRELGAEPQVTYPGVDLDAVSRTGQRSPEPLILCASDASDQRKRVELLVEAHTIIRREHPEARLVLSVPRDRVLAARFEGLPGLELADLDDRDELARHYSAAWVTALPAADEAFGLVVAESLACGTPAVGAADGGVAEILGDARVGSLFDGTSESLAEEIAAAFELVGEPGIEDRCRARAERFSIDACVEAYLSLYREVLR